jgi:hypothetical protein
MGSGASIYSEQLYLDIDTSRLSSDESMEGMDNDTNDTFLTNDSMDSVLFLSEDVLDTFTKVLYKVIYIFYLRMFWVIRGCFARFYKSDLQKRVLGITQVEHHQRQVDGHANQACDDQGDVHDKIAMKYPQ